ncbi:MAG: hypothetical protein QOG64_1184, partial [Acidimicrobiaceae bacterium]|nr:hypothetical protein [Acidimicrobiaceae bacterium]
MSQTKVATEEAAETRPATVDTTPPAGGNGVPGRSPLCLRVAPVCVVLAVAAMAVAAAGAGPTGLERVCAALVVAWAGAGTAL